MIITIHFRSKWIIPARAGSTHGLHLYTHQVRDHPRSCGEHPLLILMLYTTLGSSPLVRGAQVVCWYVVVMERIIPARAGSTNQFNRRCGPGRDHPRSCGEHSILKLCLTSLKGSSPLVRGAPKMSNIKLMTVGIIPARAGSTQSRFRHLRSMRDHPRSCGEHPAAHDGLLHVPGSSPLVRGALEGVIVDYKSARIIPARAGSTIEVYLTCYI